MQFSNRIAIPQLFVSDAAADKLRDEAQKLPGWNLCGEQGQILRLLICGGLFPLRGYMSQAEAQAVAATGTLPGGHVWPCPITLRITPDFSAGVEPGQDIALWLDGLVVAILSVTDSWVMEGDPHLGGRIKGLPMRDGRTTPNDLRAIWDRIGADRVVAGSDLRDLPADAPAILMTDAGRIPATLPELVQGFALPLFDAQDRPMMRAIIARNAGATHLAARDAAGIADALADLGLSVHGQP